MLRTFQEQPGFIRYGLADIGDRKAVSMSLWETRKDADASVPVAERWIRENVANQVDLQYDPDRGRGLLRRRAREGLTQSAPAASRHAAVRRTGVHRGGPRFPRRE